MWSAIRTLPRLAPWLHSQGNTKDSRRAVGLVQPPRRNFTRPLDAKELGSVNLLEIKRFLRQKALEFKESHACLRIPVPRHLLLAATVSGADQAEGQPPPPQNWRHLDSAFASVFVNKTTGTFVCVDPPLSGDWKGLQSFLLVWHRNRGLRRGETAEAYPSPGQKVSTETPAEAAALWSQSSPVEGLPVKDYRYMRSIFLHPAHVGQVHSIGNVMVNWDVLRLLPIVIITHV